VHLMKVWTNNRIARLVCALLAVAVLVGVEVLIYRVAAAPATACFYWGLERGRDDAAGHVDMGPDIAGDLPSAWFYFGALPGLMEDEEPPGAARDERVRRAFMLVQRVFRAAPEQRKRCIQAFVAGYRLGHSLKRP
jgi:hypothetical protein